MKKFIENIRNGFSAAREDDERGDLVQMIMIIAAVVVMVGIVMFLLWEAIKDQANDTSDAIKNGTVKIK